MSVSYVVLTETRIRDDEGRTFEYPILIGTRHIISIVDVEYAREIRLTDRTLFVTERWDQLQAVLDASAGIVDYSSPGSGHPKPI